MKRTWMAVAGGVVAGAALVAVMTAAGRGGGVLGPWRAKQVVLITIDALRADRLGCYGYTEVPTSPSIDDFARTAGVFDRAMAAAPWTVPSLGALFTGRYPAEVGAYTNKDGISPDFATLAELFRAHGFATASFNTHALLVNARGGFRRGFETVVPDRVRPTVEGEHKVAFASTEPHLMRWLDAHAHEPFFLWIHDMDTHLPPTPGNPYAAREDWTRYEGEVRLVDDAFGRIMAKLKALGLGADLFVALTADHGEAFDEHGILGHQDVMYDEVLRVPLLVRYPAALPARIDAPVELFDLFATIAELAGLPLPAGTHSESLVPLLTGARSHRTKARSFHARYFFENDDHWLAARDDTFKLLARTPDLGPPDDEGAGRVPRWDLDTDGTYLELYDVVHDPAEEHDLFEQNPDIVERLKGELAAWGKLVANPPKRAVPELDDATREALRALGYDD